MPKDSSGPFDAAIARLVQSLVPRAAELAARLGHEEPAYQPGVYLTEEDVVTLCREGLCHAVAYLDGDTRAALDAARRCARTRAEKGVPMSAALHAYRIGGQFVWSMLLAEAEIQQASLREWATRPWTVLDAMSEAVCQGYRQLDEEHVHYDEGIRTAVIEALFTGTPGDTMLGNCARGLRLPVEGRFVAVVAEMPAPDRPGLPKIAERLRARGIQSVWRQEYSSQTGLVVLTTRFGVDELSCEVTAEAGGRIGVSEVFERITDTPLALGQALLAQSAALPGSTALVRYDQAFVPLLIAGAPEAARRMAVAVLGSILSLPYSQRGLLLDTLRAWLSEGGSPSATARRLHCHRNTVRYRLHRITELTGKDMANPADVSQLYLALEVLDIVPI